MTRLSSCETSHSAARVSAAGTRTQRTTHAIPAAPFLAISRILCHICKTTALRCWHFIDALNGTTRVRTRHPDRAKGPEEIGLGSIKTRQQQDDP